MRMTTFPQIAAAILLVTIASLTAAYMGRMRTRGKPFGLRFVCLLLPSIILFGLLIYLCVMSTGLWYSDQCYARLPRERVARHTVAASFPLLFEREVSGQDVPPEYRSEKLLADGVSVCRYSFLLPVFGFHAVYDSDGVLVEAIPTYE